VGKIKEQIIYVYTWDIMLFITIVQFDSFLMKELLLSFKKRGLLKKKHKPRFHNNAIIIVIGHNDLAWGKRRRELLIYA